MSVKHFSSFLIGLVLFPLLPLLNVRNIVRERQLLALKSHPVDAPRQLLVDVSVIVKNDAGTGVQRVVRGILLQLLENPPVGFSILPVYATRKHGYRYAPDFLQSLSDTQLVNEPVTVSSGDIFLGLDLAAHLLPKHRVQLIEWKQRGVALHVVVYDLLPLLHPEWFNAKTVRNFRRWIKVLAMLADSAICISGSAKADLGQWVVEHYKFTPDMLKIDIMPLGMDIDATLPSKGLPENTNELIQTFRENTTVLMVGTIEPRKGYAQVLAAFDLLWHQKSDLQLVIVGKPGWKTEILQKYMRAHPQYSIRFWWFDKASDEFLEQLYAASAAVLIASNGEGFGLPIVEATRHSKSVLARDIPVFREIASGNVTFFQTEHADILAENIVSWLKSVKQGDVLFSNELLASWSDGARQLVSSMGVG